ncbi:MAG: DUF4097 domain-containing protein [Acidobacteria bacterium]|nr:DUF4097 domain-containing protein [Acidobacteriota bacterium]
MFKRIATLLLGIGLIGLGVLFFVAPERVFIVQLLTRFWPLFLVLAGMVRVAGYLIDRHPRSPVGGMILTAIGGILLAVNLRGDHSIIRIFGDYWFWLLLALVIGRVLRQYTHRLEDGSCPRAFSPGAIVLMLLIASSGLAANYLAKKHQNLAGLNLGISRFGDLGDYVFGNQLAIEDEPPQTFALLPNSRLIINSSTGDIEITAAPQAEASARIIKRIRALKEEEAKKAAQNIHLQISPDGNNFQLNVNASGVQQDFSTSIILTLPQNLQAGIEIMNCLGSVKLAGLRGDHIIRNGSKIEVIDNLGRITIENPRGFSGELNRVRGDVSLHVRDSRINLREITGAVAISAERSRIEAEKIEGDLTVDNSDERVIAHRIEGAVRIKANDGAVELEDVRGITTVQATRDVSVRNFRGLLDVTTQDGTIKLSTDEKIAGEVKAVNQKGRISLSMPEDSDFRIDAVSKHGRVRVRGFDQLILPRKERSVASGYHISESAHLVSLRSNEGEIRVQSSGQALASREDD